jgi:hypothetical protein
MAEIDEMLRVMLEASRDHDVEKAMIQIEKFVEGYTRSHIYS